VILIESKTRKGSLIYKNHEHKVVAVCCPKCSEIVDVREVNMRDRICKPCKNEYKKLHYRKNKERYKHLHKKYQEEHKDTIQLYHKNWKLENKDRVLENRDKYNKQNAKRLCEKSKEWLRNNKDKRAKISRKYTQANKDKINASKRVRRKKSPFKEVRTDWRIDKTLPHVQYFMKDTLALKRKIKELNYGKSATDHFTLDHIIPLKHPQVCGLNIPCNYQILTRKQNSFKNNSFDGTYNNDSWHDAYKKLSIIND